MILIRVQPSAAHCMAGQRTAAPVCESEDASEGGRVGLNGQ